MINTQGLLDNPDTVLIALCAYQGSSFIGEQIKSLLNQTHPCRIVVHDDHSNDDTVEVANTLLRSGIDQCFVHQQNLGYIKNFEQAITHALASESRYIALSDQDDIWHKNRLKAGIAKIKELEQRYGSQTPLLVHSDLTLMNASGNRLHDSFFTFRQYRISNSKNLDIVLGENGVMGNTVLMNREMAALAIPFPQGLHMHDYWLAVLAELFGQRSVLDEPYVHYRLHDRNVSNVSSSVQQYGFRRLLRPAWKTLFTRNYKLPFKEDSRALAIEYLLNHQSHYPAIKPEYVAKLEPFLRYVKFQQNRTESLRYLLSSGVTRPGLLHKARLCLAVPLTQRYQSANEG